MSAPKAAPKKAAVRKNSTHKRRGMVAPAGKHGKAKKMGALKGKKAKNAKKGKKGKKVKQAKGRSNKGGAVRGWFGERAEVLDVRTKAPGPQGSLPLTDEMLRNWSSGDLFGLTQDAGMGWNPSELNRREFLILSTQGGIRSDDGSPVALGYHTGHWEVGLLMREAAEELKRMGCVPFAGYCSDPCDGRTQGLGNAALLT